MQQAQISDGTLTIASGVDVPTPGPDHARVRITSAGVCHSDLHLARGDWAGVVVPVCGHEAIGVVEELGEGAERFTSVGDRVILGLGVSNVGLNAARGHAWQPPLPTMRNYLDALDGVTVDAVAPVTPPERIVAAHGPALQRLAAARADGLMTYLMPPEHTATSRARAGADTGISVVCPVLAESDPNAARAHVRGALAYYLGLDYYHREWRKLGFDDTDFADGGSDRLVDTITCWGDADALHARVEAYARAGATRVILLPLEQVASDGDSIATLAPGSG